MSVSCVENYMNPLTLEAKMFLEALKRYSQVKQVDINLCQLLHSIVEEINRFASSKIDKIDKIVSSENSELMKLQDIDMIKRLYFCNHCKKHIGGSATQVIKHIKNKHVLTIPDTPRATTAKDMKNYTKKPTSNDSNNEVLHKIPSKGTAFLASFIAGDVSRFFDEKIKVGEKLKMIPEYAIIEKQLLDVLTPEFAGKSIKIYFFGSRMSGVGTRNSDVDIFIDIGNTFHEYIEDNGQENTQLKIARKALRAAQVNWSHMISIEKTRVPIIRTRNITTAIDCDISFTTSLGFCNTKLVEYLFQLQPIARRMCIFIKIWIERFNLKSNMSTYAMTLMIIYFLQINKYLPSIESLQSNLDDSTVHIGPWIGNFMEKKLHEWGFKKIDVSTDNFNRFMKLFFELYADFNYSVYAICPYLGRLVDISSIELDMPERFHTFIKANTNKRQLQKAKCMVIQDPFELNHNVTKAVPVYLLRQLVSFFQYSTKFFP